MELKYVQGRKHPEDKIILVKTDGWEAPTFIELLRLIVVHLKNEDRIYNKGMGGHMLIAAIIEAWKGATQEEIEKRFKL